MVVRTKAKENDVRTEKATSSIKPATSATPTQLLTPLLISKSEKLAAYKKRKDQYLYESILPSDTEKYESSGWILHKESKTRVRMKHLKQHKQSLDDQAWCLFYRMGYPELSADGFKAKYTQADGTAGERKLMFLQKMTRQLSSLSASQEKQEGERV